MQALLNLQSLGGVLEFQAVKDDPSLTGVDMRIPAQRHANVEKTGALWRQSTLLKVWKKSYVVITKESLMFWYASERDSAPEDVLALKKVNGVRREESSIRPHAFVISGKGVVFAFAAEGEQEMESWLRAIGKGIVNASTTEWDETSDRLEARE